MPPYKRMIKDALDIRAVLDHSGIAIGQARVGVFRLLSQWLPVLLLVDRSIRRSLAGFRRLPGRWRRSSTG
jgi:hypothetical protein